MLVTEGFKHIIADKLCLFSGGNLIHYVISSLKKETKIPFKSKLAAISLPPPQKKKIWLLVQLWQKKIDQRCQEMQVTKNLICKYALFCSCILLNGQKLKPWKLL